MRGKKRSIGTFALAAALSIGIVVPRPARANPAPLLVLGGFEGSKAFVALANPYVAVGVGVIVLGVAGYQYYQSNAAEKWDDSRADAPRSRPDLRIVPDPPPTPEPSGKGPSARDTILEILSARELIRQLKRKAPDSSASPSHEEAPKNPDQKPKKKPDKEKNPAEEPKPDEIPDAGPEVFPGTVVIRAEREAPPPPRIGIRDVITPQMIGHIMNSGQHTYNYRPENRYGPQTEWGAFNPDLIAQWSKDPSNRKFQEAVNESKNSLRSFVKNIGDFKADAESLRLDSRSIPPPGVDGSVANEELGNIEIDFSRFRYHEAFQRIYELVETIREIELLPEQKATTDYLKSELNKKFLGVDGLPHNLPLDRLGQKKFDRSTEEGNRAATLASELLLTKKKVRAAWSYTAAKDGLTQSQKPEDIARISTIAHSVETFEITSDRLIDELLDLSHGKLSGPLSADQLRELSQSAAQMGEKLERATEPMEKTIGDWNQREVPKVYPSVTPAELAPGSKDIPETVEQERNWRRVVEIIAQEGPVSDDELHYGPGPEKSTETPAQPEAPPPADSQPDEKPAPEKAPETTVTPPAKAPRGGLEKIREAVKKIREDLNRRGLRDRFGNLFEIVEVIDGDANNARDADPENGSFTRPGTAKDTAVLVLKNLKPVRFGRGHHDNQFTFHDNKYYASDAALKNPDGSPLTQDQFRKRYSIPNAPKRIAIVEFDEGHEIRASITSDIAGGDGGELQYKIEKPIPGRYRIISDDPLLP